MGMMMSASQAVPRNQMLCLQPPGVYSHNLIWQQSANVQQFLPLRPLITLEHAL